MKQRNRRQAAAVILGVAALLPAGGVPAGATGAGTQELASSAMVCMLRLGSIDAAGNLVSQQVVADRPPTSPMTGVVKMVRERTWQGFEAMVAERCGRYGTLLVGIDKDTRTGYLYAVGRANGFATVIQLVGKVPASLIDPAYFRVASASAAPPYGE